MQVSQVLFFILFYTQILVQLVAKNLYYTQNKDNVVKKWSREYNRKVNNNIIGD